ncbi:MAG: hypothetical protein ACTSRG_25915 [Candidatus Helarchaeota archaeon]
MPDEIGIKLINFIKYSLTSMSEKFTDLSELRWEGVKEDLKKQLIEQKIQELPYIYEFFHQFRKYWSMQVMRKVFAKSAYIQPQINKQYQDIPDLKRIPDFLIHVPNAETNIAAIELKLAQRKDVIQRDLNLLLNFKEKLGYQYLIEILVGNFNELEEARAFINDLDKDNGIEINIVMYNTEDHKADSFSIQYS